MRKSIFTLLSSMLALSASAQLVNNGATITVQAGATLMVESNVDNQAGGVINLEGNAVLEIKGNFTNSNALGGIQAAAGSKVKFTGDAGSTITLSGDTIANLEIAKSTTGMNVTVEGKVVVAEKLTFNSPGVNKLVASTNDTVVFGPNVASTDVEFANPDEYIVTGAAGAAGMGTVIKSYTNGALAASAFKFEVGDAAVYSPLETSITGTAASGSLAVRVNDIAHPNKPTDAESFISRYWDVDASGISSYVNVLTGTYDNATDDSGTQSFIKGASQATDLSNVAPNNTPYGWNFAAAATNSTTTITGTVDNIVSSDFTGMNFYGKADLKVFLEGPFDVTTGFMKTTLNSATGFNVLENFAINSPYTDASAMVPAGFFLAHPAIVDWIKLEVFSSSPANFNTSSAIAKTSALLLNDGSIVGTDFNSLPLLKNANLSSIIKIVHRNHLPIRTDGAVSVDSASPIDFRTGSTFFNNGSSNNPMALSTSSKNLMWRGNVNSLAIPTAVDHSINVADFGLVKINTAATGANIYSFYDVNFDGSKNVADFGLVKLSTAVTKSADL